MASRPPQVSMVPKYSHPFTLYELGDLDTNLISEEIQRLHKSLAMLESTNATLRESLASSSSSAIPSEQLDADDEKLFKETIDENEEAIAAQKERIDMCIFVLKARLGIDPTNTHYDLNPDTTSITARPTTTPGVNGISSQTDSLVGAVTGTANGRPGQSVENDEQDGGMYL